MVTRIWRTGWITNIGLLLVLCGSLMGCATTDFSLQQGEELSAAGRWEEAVKFYLDAAAREPSNIEVRLGLARAL